MTENQIETALDNIEEIKRLRNQIAGIYKLAEEAIADAVSYGEIKHQRAYLIPGDEKYNPYYDQQAVDYASRAVAEIKAKVEGVGQ